MEYKNNSVARFLAIYRTRMRMQESGVTNPSKEVKAFTKELVQKLSQMPLDEEIDLIDQSFVDSKGNVIIRFPR